jgi:hypothetical protein
MTAHHRSTFLLAITLLIGSSGAAAQAADEAAPAERPLTRAEVIADLEIWRASGMAALTDGEAGSHVFGAAYEAAFAKYVVMRADPMFAQRVTQIAQADARR